MGDDGIPDWAYDMVGAEHGTGYTLRSAIQGVTHYVDGHRVWCPPMCPIQDEPRPRTAWGRWRWRRTHRHDRL